MVVGMMLLASALLAPVEDTPVPDEAYEQAVLWIIRHVPPVCANVSEGPEYCLALPPGEPARPALVAALQGEYPELRTVAECQERGILGETATVIRLLSVKRSEDASVEMVFQGPGSNGSVRLRHQDGQWPATGGTGGIAGSRVGGLDDCQSPSPAPSCAWSAAWRALPHLPPDGAAPFPPRRRKGHLELPRPDRRYEIKGRWTFQVAIDDKGETLDAQVVARPEVTPPWPEFESYVRKQILRLKWTPALDGNGTAVPACLDVRLAPRWNPWE